MYNATEQFSEINKASVSSAIKLASLSIENAEKLVQLNINAAKLAIAQAVEGAQAAASAKDVQELLSLRAKLAEVGVQSATGYSRTTRVLCTNCRRKRKPASRRSPKSRGRRTRRASPPGSRRPARTRRPALTSPSTR